VKEEVCSLARGKRIHHVVLADSQLLFRRGLRTLLAAETDIAIVAEVSSLEELTLLLKSSSDRPLDVVVMDMALLQGVSDFDLLKIRQAQASTPMLFLSREDNPETLELAMKAGGRPYMLKSTPAPELVSGIRRVAVGQEETNIESTADLKALADSGQKFVKADVLTNREQEILRLLAEGRTVRETAAELALSMKTVEAHKLNLMRKLNIHTRAILVEYALEKGFISAAIPA
jgi:two-component system response regulator NreC